MQAQQPPFPIEEIVKAFDIKGDYKEYRLSNDGHINNTYVVDFVKDGKTKSYLLQLINTNVFKNPDELMENIVGVTEYVRDIVIKNGGDKHRECLKVYPTVDNKPYYKAANGDCWRIYNFIINAHTSSSIESAETFQKAAKAFGNFQRMLADYPSETLHETIPNFHNTASRYLDFEKAVKDNIASRADTVRDEIEFVRARKADASVLVDLLAKGELPLRVTHNDTKLNNVMLDDVTNEGICVIDLDTVMPGLSLYDFGDSIRFGANTAAEDEKDLSKVSLSLDLYKAYTEGYLGAAGKSLTKTEVEYLPFSSKLMTFECGMRFLTDYLNGDTYFRISYPEHNLDRCRTQFMLVHDMEKKMDDMKKITQDIYTEIVK